MAEILLREDEARTNASSVIKAASAAQADFDSLKSSLSSLQDSFRGKSAQAFEMRYDEWSTAAKQLIESLDGLGQFLNAAADTIAQTDTEIASKLQ